MEDFVIKEVDVKDVNFLRDVALKAYADHYLDLWYDQGQWYMDKYFSVEKLSEELNDKNSLFFIAFLKNHPVGFLKLNIDAPLEGFEGKNALELERIYLNKEAAGKGIGRELAKLTFRISKQNNKEMVWLKAMDSSTGPIAFYEKMGFKISGTYHLKHSLMKEDLRGMVVMIKEITGE